MNDLEITEGMHLEALKCGYALIKFATREAGGIVSVTHIPDSHVS